MQIIKEFVVLYDERGLEPREEAIIHGSLRNLTYQEIKESYAILQYTVEYISRNLAPDLRKRLTDVVVQSPIEPKFKVMKRNLWYLVEQMINVESDPNSRSTVIPSQPMEGRMLLDRYEIEEHLFDRDSGERHYEASDRLTTLFLLLLKFAFDSFG